MDGLYDYEISYLLQLFSWLLSISTYRRHAFKRDLITTLSFSTGHKTRIGILLRLCKILVLGEIPESFYSGRGYTVLFIFNSGGSMKMKEGVLIYVLLSLYPCRSTSSRWANLGEQRCGLSQNSKRHAWEAYSSLCFGSSSSGQEAMRVMGPFVRPWSAYDARYLHQTVAFCEDAKA